VSRFPLTLALSHQGREYKMRFFGRLRFFDRLRMSGGEEAQNEREENKVKG